MTNDAQTQRYSYTVERRRKEEAGKGRMDGKWDAARFASASSPRVARFLYLGPSGYSRPKYLPASRAAQRYLPWCFDAYRERELGDGLERRALQ